jgi:hypothetical protein
MRCREHIETLFLYHVAPILNKVRPAVLITLRANCLHAWQEKQNELRDATGLKSLEIKGRNNSCLLLVYNEALLAAKLRDAGAMALLSEYGYPAGCGVAATLSFLCERFEDCPFPHEIGMFLGYPPKDVVAFIKNNGQNCICCRYWKVYHDEKEALEAFKRIDAAHELAMQVLSKSLPLYAAAELLKAA